MFPHLHELFIVGCPKLSRKWPELLPSLETLIVSKCPELLVSVSNFSMLCRLEFDECKGLLEFRNCTNDRALFERVTALK
ncbi:hypothetical protein CUMW_175580 [Citrus unshiu]|nr:hypothetical protein CUMW_175580 [Citrus unshiu]